MITNRMPRTQRIPLIEPPADIDSLIDKIAPKENDMSLFSIRDYLINANILGTLEAKIIEQMSAAAREVYYKARKEIRAETDCAKLLTRLKDHDSTNQERDCIIKRLIELDENVYELFLGELRHPYSEKTFDAIYIVLSFTIQKKDISEKIIGILNQNYVRNPVDFASLVQILGYRKTRQNLRYLYTYYRFFINNSFKGECYKGPALGLYYYKYW